MTRDELVSRARSFLFGRRQAYRSTFAGPVAEEVLRVVDPALGRAREVGQVERRDAKQLSRPFRIAGGQDRRVHPVEAVLVEVAMHGHGELTHRDDGSAASAWAAAAEQIIALAHARTHAISAALLADLAHGESYTALRDFANALAIGDDHSALSAATAVTRIGASSGWDMLAGFVAALRGRAHASAYPVPLNN